MTNTASGNGGVRDAKKISDDFDNIASQAPLNKPTIDVLPNWRRLDHVIDDLMARLTSESEAS